MGFDEHDTHGMPLEIVQEPDPCDFWGQTPRNRFRLGKLVCSTDIRRALSVTACPGLLLLCHSLEFDWIDVSSFMRAFALLSATAVSLPC